MQLIEKFKKCIFTSHRDSDETPSDCPAARISETNPATKPTARPTAVPSTAAPLKRVAKTVASPPSIVRRQWFVSATANNGTDRRQGSAKIR